MTRKRIRRREMRERREGMEPRRERRDRGRRRKEGRKTRMNTQQSTTMHKGKAIPRARDGRIYAVE